MLLIIGQYSPDLTKNLLVGGGTGNPNDFRVQLLNTFGVVTFSHAARDKDAPVFSDGLADSVEAFRLGAVDEAAGIHYHNAGIMIIRGNFVPFNR